MRSRYDRFCPLEVSDTEPARMGLRSVPPHPSRSVGGRSSLGGLTLDEEGGEGVGVAVLTGSDRGIEPPVA